MLESRHDCEVLAIVGVEQHNACHIGPLLELLAQDCRGTVMTAVVYENDLVSKTHLVQRWIEPREQTRQSGLFVIDGNDDRQDRFRHVLLPKAESALVCGEHFAQRLAYPVNVGHVHGWK